MVALLSLPATAHAAPVTGDFDGDGKADLAIDAEGQAVNGHAHAGAVQVLYGSRHGPSGARDRVYTEETPGIPGSAEDFGDFGAALATGHFNSDRFADLAIGSPFKDSNGVQNSGAVTILYGSRHGLRAHGSQVFIDGQNGLPSSLGQGEDFGYSLAAANFGRSREDDLAVGSAFANVDNVANTGAVELLYGTSKGLRGKHSRRITQDTPGVQDQAEQEEGFGFVVAAADFGRDTHADLAIGVVFEDVGGNESAGAVNVLYGSRRGIVTRGNQFFTQDTPGVKDAAEGGDDLGSGLAAANFGRNGRADLAIGARGESVGTADFAGAANVLYGSRHGLRAKGSQLLTQDSLEVGGGSEPDDEFGRALAAANFGHGKRVDLAVGAPNECVGSGMCAQGGAVDVVYGARRGLSRRGAEEFSQDTPGVQDSAEADDDFGWTVAAGRFRGAKVNDLAIGALGEDVVSFGDRAGAVAVLRGSAGGITAAHDLFLTQGSGGLEGTPEQYDIFGSQLSGPSSPAPFD